MPMRNITFAIGEYYHLYNRGTDKRNIFGDEKDLSRFFQSMVLFNTRSPIGSIHERLYELKGKGEQVDALGSLAPKKERLVDFFCYCLNPNHFHFGLTPLVERGIEKYMQRLGTGYTNYFNEKLMRAGSLFQGPYKAVHLSDNAQLLHVSVYINLNNRFGGKPLTLSKSSWDEYSGKSKKKGVCATDIVLSQFRGRGYERFALSSLQDIVRRKKEKKEWKDLLFE